MRLFEFEDIEQKFGKILFGTFRKKSEKDTDFEAKVFKQLQKYTEIESMSSTSLHNNFQLLINALEILKSNKEKFSDILIPNNTTVYRGYRSPIQQIRNLNWTEKDNIWFEAPYMYSPKKILESWSTSLNVAAGFSVMDYDLPDSWDISSIYKDAIKNKINDYKSFDNDSLPVVVYTEINDDFIFNSKFMDYLSFEKENLRLSNEPLQVKILVPQMWIDYFKIPIRR